MDEPATSDPCFPTWTLRNPLESWTAPLPLAPDPGTRRLLRFLVTLVGGAVRIEGTDRLPGAARPALFVFNHSNSFEALAAPVALSYLRGGAPIRFFVDWMFLHYPLLGPVLRRSRPLPVWGKPLRVPLFEGYRRARWRAEPPLPAALAALAAGESVGLFPEGTRNPRPDRLLPARRGLAWLALRSTVPVVPVGIRHPAAERLGRTPIVGRLTLAVGRTLDLAAERGVWAAACAHGEPDAGLERRLGRAVAGRVMAELSRLSGKALPDPSLRGQAPPSRREAALASLWTPADPFAAVPRRAS